MIADSSQSSGDPRGDVPGTRWTASTRDLYELSLAIGVSTDPQTLCRDFLAALQPRLGLAYAAVWLKRAGPGQHDHSGLDLLLDAPAVAGARDRPPPCCPQPGFGRPWAFFDAHAGPPADGTAGGETTAWIPLGELGCLELRRPALGFAEGELAPLLPLLARFTGSLRAAIGLSVRLSEPLAQSSEARFHALAEQSADWIWTLDLQGRHTYSNHRVSDILGYQRDQFLEADALQLVHPDDRAMFTATFQEAVERRTGWQHVLLRWRHRDGRYRALESNATAALDADGRLLEFQGIDRDVTDRVEREQASRRLASIVEHSSDFIGVADLDGRMRAVNPAGRSLVGLESVLDLESARMWDFIHESSREVFTGGIVPAVLHSGHWQGELNLRHFRSGVAVPVLSDIFRIDGCDSQPLHIATVSQDIRERKRSTELLDRHNRLLRSVAAGSAVLVTERSEQGMMSAICRILVEQGGYRMAWIGRIARDDARVLPVAWAGARTDYLAEVDIRCDDSPQGQGPTGTAIRTGRSVVVDDLAAETRYSPWRHLALSAAFHSSAATPVRVQGRVLGSLNVYSGEFAAFGADEVLLLEKLAADLGSALDRQWAEAALRESEARYRLISSVTTNLLFSCLRAEDGAFAIDWAAGSVEPIFGCSLEELTAQSCWRCFVHPADVRIFDRDIQQLALGQTSECELRVLRKDGSVRYLRVYSKVVEDERTARPRLYGACQDVTERRKAEERIEYLAQHDALTGLPNRVLLQDRFERARALADRHDSHVAVLFLDLDNFKVVNDTLGHAAGDRLLQSVVKRLHACVRDTDTVSRQGGDEFIVLLDDILQTTVVERIVGTILEHLAAPLEIDRNVLTTSGSIGICLYPQDGRDFELLLQKADAAMYAAKAAGRNGYRFFDEEMNRHAQEHLRLQQRLHQALAGGELTLHYQPLVELVGGRVVGAEALLRWPHPEHGEVLPAHFVPVAEDCGLMVPIGAWVLEEACRQARRWREQGLGDLTLSVNLSPVQLQRRGFADTVAAALASSGVAPERLELDLTESVLRNDAAQILDNLGQLRAMGVRLAIDDFGTGYSSLSDLRRLPVDKLKIDRSFIRDVATDADGAAIVRSILQLARSLRLKTVAEGVETEEQAELLRQAGCAQAQGYLFSPPVPPERLAAWMRGRGPRAGGDKQAAV